MLFFMLSGYWVARMQAGPHHLPVPQYLAITLYADLAINSDCRYFRLSRVPFRWFGRARLFAVDACYLRTCHAENDSVSTIWSLDIELQFYVLLPMLLSAALWRQRAIVAADLLLPSQ